MYGYTVVFVSCVVFLWLLRGMGTSKTCTISSPSQVSSVRLPRESSTNRMRGFGYAELPTSEDLEHALSLDGEVGRAECGSHGNSATLCNRSLEAEH